MGLGAAALPARVRAACAPGFGPLQAADANGLMLPAGFTSRVVATTGATVGATSHVWHAAPDGGATFASPGGGWVYVSNAELAAPGGGVGAIAFAPDGAIVDAYSILSGTRVNCAGGPTPWGTWLSCEEVTTGRVYECDPFTPGSQGVVRSALGWFRHEAAAVDPVRQQLYLTEDNPDGLLYRFTPGAWPDLSAGVLEAAQVLDPGGQGAIVPGQTRPLAWHVVPTPNPGVNDAATRYQVAQATPFAGGEGIWYQAGVVAFTTKHDNRVWQLDAAAQTLTILYDFATSSDPALRGVDNVTVSPCGDVYVAEEGGNLEIVALGEGGFVEPVVRLTGVTGTEMAGPAFSPDARRLYFSSQRNPGVTYEVSGPFAPLAVPSLGGFWGAAALGALACGAWWRQRPVSGSSA
jgi:secreted PhoX family phosphatase